MMMKDDAWWGILMHDDEWWCIMMNVKDERFMTGLWQDYDRIMTGLYRMMTGDTGWWQDDDRVMIGWW